MKGNSTKSIIIAAFVLVILCITFFVFATYKNMKETQTQNTIVNNSLEILLAMENLLIHLEQLETQQRGYTFTNKEQFAEPYKKALKNFIIDTTNLSILLKHKPERAKDLNTLIELIEKKIDYSKQTILLFDSAGVEPVVTVVKLGTGRLLSDSIRTITSMVMNRDNTSLNEANSYLRHVAERTTLRFFLLASFFILLLLLFFVIISNNLKNRQIASEKLAYNASLTDTISDAVFSTDRNFIIQSWNKYATVQYGVSSENAIGKSLPTLLKIHLSEAEIEQSLLELNQKGNFLSEYLVTTQNGKDIFVLASISTLLNQQGNITGYVAVHRDITERKRLEDQLKVFNHQLEMQVNIKTAELSDIFERITDGFIALDKNWRYTYVNKRVCQLMGMKQDELIGKNIWDEFPDLNNLAFFYDYYNKAMVEQRYYFLELYYPPLNIWLENHIYPSPTGISVYYRNVTQKKEAEEKARKASELSEKVIDSLPGIFFMHQKLTKGLFRWNKKLEIISGYTPEEIANKNINEFIDEADFDILIKKLEEGFELGQTELETNILTKEGKKIPFYFTAMVIEVEGKPFLIGNGLDISQRKKAEAQSQKNFEKIQLLAKLSEAISQAKNVHQIYEISLEALKKNIGADKVCIGLFDEKNQLKIVADNGLSESFKEHLQSNSFAGNHFKETNFVIISAFDAAPALQQNTAVFFAEGIKTAGYFPLIYQHKPIGEFTLLFNKPRTLSGDEIQLIETIARTVAFAINEKKYELALIASTQKYKLLFYNNPMPMWMLSYPERDFVDVNEAAILHFGYSREEFMKMNARDLRPQEDWGLYLQLKQQIMATKSYKGIWRYKKKNGEIIKVEIIAHDIIYEGNNVRLLLANDIDEKIKAEERLQESYRQIRQLATHLQNIREEERTKIAREIHDELGQQLTGLKMYVSWLNKKMIPQEIEIKEKFQNTMELIEDTIKTVRKISTELRPSMLDDLGLLAAMEWQSNEFEKRSGITTSFIDLTGNKPIETKFTTGLFRIFQESLTNVARHADAKKIITSLAFDDKQLQLTITDDGKGFVVDDIGSKKTLGLFGMKERTMEMGGNYEIKSEPGLGTTVFITIPLQ
jgi:PAS domain S-box-containing protein